MTLDDFDPNSFRNEIIDATNSAESRGQQIVDAIRIAEAACQKFPSSSRLHCVLADLISLSSITSTSPEAVRDKAKLIYEAAVKIDPFDPEPYRSLGDLAMLQGCIEEAESLYDKSLSCQEDMRTYIALVSLFATFELEEKKVASMIDCENYLQSQRKSFSDAQLGVVESQP